MSTVKFVPKPGKPHIKIIKDKWGGSNSYYLHHTIDDIVTPNHLDALNYCLRVNEGQYGTPGDAARALFNYKGYR